MKISFKNKLKKLLRLRQVYNIYLRLIDCGIIKTKHYHSQIFQYSTAVKLINRFGGSFGHGTNVKSGNLGFGLIHYSFINILKPERILCIGSQKGFIPAICALACQENNRGHVDFVDAGKYSHEKNDWGGIGFWKDNNPKEHFAQLKIDKYISTYVIDSNKFAQKFKNRKYDYIYIDADHSYKGVKSDFDNFWPRLTNGGIMSFHDINMKGLNHGVEYGVWKLWKEIKENSKLSFTTFDNAIGFVQKNE